MVNILLKIISKPIKTYRWLMAQNDAEKSPCSIENQNVPLEPPPPRQPPPDRKQEIDRIYKMLR